MSTNYEVIATPTLAKGPFRIGVYRTASEAYAAARNARPDWPEGSFKLEIREVEGD